MNDQRGSLVTVDAPTVDQKRLAPQTGVAKPVETPSLWSQFSNAAMGAAGRDELGTARQQDAIDAGLAPIVDELNRRGIKAGAYTARNARDGFALSYNEDTIWQGIGQARASDPDAFKGVEGTPQAFRQRVTAPVAARIAQEQQTNANSGWVPWMAGSLYGGFADPEQQAGLLVGAGAARSVVGAMVRDAGINASLTALDEPQKAALMAKQGQVLTPGQVAADVGTAGVIGAGLGGLIHGGLSLAKQARAAVPSERMTDAERTAMSTLETTGEVAATSPFQPGAGTDAHFAKMDRAAAALDDPPAVARETSRAAFHGSDAGLLPTRTAVPPGAFDLRDYARRLAVVESGGKTDARAATSSAYGLYQITRGTFLRYARQVNSMIGSEASDDAVWALRTNPAMQEGVFRRLTDDNRAALARIGAPETNGNLYLMHFAGEGGAERILRAAPDTAIETLMNPRAIEANPWMRGKTAGDLIDWAHGKMGEAPHSGPVLRRDGFEHDEEWAAAQREVDAIDADDRARLAAGREMPPRGEGNEFDGDGGDGPRPTIAASRDAFDPNDLFAEDTASHDTLPEAKGRDWEPAEEGTPRSRDSKWRDALDRLIGEQGGEAPGVLYHPDTGPIDVKWGEAGDPARDFKGGHGLAHIMAKHPDMAPMLDRLPEMIRDMDVKQHRPERVVLENPTHEASIALTWHGADQRWLLTAYEKGAPAAPNSVRGAIDGAAGFPRPEAQDDIGGVGRRANPRTIEEAAAELGRRPEMEAQPRTDGFDTPGDHAAERQMASLEHDLRMLMADDEMKGLTVRLNEEGDVISLADALAEADGDEAAIGAAERCMTGGEA